MWTGGMGCPDVSFPFSLVLESRGAAANGVGGSGRKALSSVFPGFR